MTDLTIGAFYIAYVALGTKLRRVEGVLEETDDQTITLAPSPTAQTPQPVKVRVYRQQIVRID
jgi:hypothetical protein